MFFFDVRGATFTRAELEVDRFRNIVPQRVPVSGGQPAQQGPRKVSRLTCSNSLAYARSNICAGSLGNSLGLCNIMV